MSEAWCGSCRRNHVAKAARTAMIGRARFSILGIAVELREIAPGFGVGGRMTARFGFPFCRVKIRLVVVKLSGYSYDGRRTGRVGCGRQRSQDRPMMLG